MKTIIYLINTDLEYNIRAVKTLVSLSKENRIIVFSKGSKGSQRFILENNRVNVFDVSQSIKENLLNKHLFICDSYNTSKNFITKKIKSNNIKPDIIYANDLPTLKTAVLLSKKFQAKLVYDSFEIYVETFNQYYPLHIKSIKVILFKFLIKSAKFLNQRIEKRFFNNVDLFITTCNSYLGYFHKKYNIKNYLLIKNTPVLIPHEKIETVDLNSMFNIDIGKKIVLYIGIFNPGRGLENLVLSGKHLAKNYHVLMIGYGTLAERLKELIKENNLKNVTIFGPYPMHRTHDFIKGADLGVLFTDSTNLSKYYSSANKVFDYMMAGVPSLLSNTPENKKIIDECQCGQIIFGEANPEAIAIEIKKVFENKDYSFMGKNGIKWIKKKFNWALDEEGLLKGINKL